MLELGAKYSIVQIDKNSIPGILNAFDSEGGLFYFELIEEDGSLIPAVIPVSSIVRLIKQ